MGLIAYPLLILYRQKFTCELCLPFQSRLVAIIISALTFLLYKTTLHKSKGTIIRSSSPQHQIILYFLASGFINFLQNVEVVAEGSELSKV